MEFKQAVVTQNGRALMAKLLAGKSTQFTKIKVSSTIYSDAQLANLTALTNIKQETTAQAYGNNTATVSVVGAIENTGLQTGYYINTVGLYAIDPDKGEILYSVSSASVNGYMPPDTGVSKSGFEFKIYTEVGNATKVDLTVDPAAYATHEDFERLEIHQAWMMGEDGEGLTEAPPQENYVLNSKTGKSQPLDASWNDNYASLSDELKGIAGNFEIGFDFIAPETIPENQTIDVTLQTKGGGLQSLTIFPFKTFKANPGDVIHLTNRFIGDYSLFTTSGGRIAAKFGIVAGSPLARIDNLYIKKASDKTNSWTPAPSDDPVNCYPKYVGFGIKASDNYQDYRWILNPDWAMANAMYGTSIVTMKDQLADIQTWIQAHS
ncbi:hypothetical protein ABXM71_08950 [Enterococcus faecium]|uniref:hypothetical protein n=1 Tax=Enterococcus faecium TaxID=1352 RepID=UPI00338D9DA3